MTRRAKTGEYQGYIPQRRETPLESMVRKAANLRAQSVGQVV